MGGLDVPDEAAVFGQCSDCSQVIHCLKSQQQVYCRDCGRTNPITSLTNVRETTIVQHKLLQHTRRMSTSLELVAFRGIHNFEAKLLSPFLTRYGMDRDGRPKLLLDMNLGSTFDCGLLSNRSFVIKEKDALIPGSGQDGGVYQTGYLSETLSKINQANSVKTACIAAHADPDGHCLVHAISRAITGTQLFWHPLREAIKNHLQRNLNQYRQLLVNYIEDSEWPLIIEEADPYYLSDGATLGLRNVHVFALANVLKRPIILLDWDSMSGMENVGDYSATFLPILVGPTDCLDKNNKANPPIAIAWASPARNHFIPILPVSNDIGTILPMTVIPPVWLAPQDNLKDYINYRHTTSGIRGLQLGGGIEFSDTYITRLVKSMREAFQLEENVPIMLVCKLYRDVYTDTDMAPFQVTQNIKQAMAESRLYLCHDCGTIGEIDSRDLKPNGESYEYAQNINGTFVDNETYELPNCLLAKYSIEHDEIKLIYEKCHPECVLCGNLTSSINVKNLSFDPKKSALIPVRRKIDKSSIVKKPVETPTTSQTSQKAGKSGNLRVKIALSDNRTDIMEFSSDISVTTFLTLLSEKFNVSIANIHSIRSGHPPKILDQNQPQGAVQFQNGDRVQVVLATASKMDTRQHSDVSPTRDMQFTHRNRDVGVKDAGDRYMSTDMKIPDDVHRLWDFAQHQQRSVWTVILDDIESRQFTSIFHEGGGYPRLMRLLKGDLIEHEHYSLMQLHDVVFCWEDQMFKVCLGCEGHFRVDDPKLYTATANDLKRNCMNLERLKHTKVKELESGPGICRITGSRAPIVDASEELAKRLKTKNKNRYN